MVFVVLSILFVCFLSRVGSKNLFKYPPCFNLFRLVSSSPSFLMDLLKNTLSFLHWSLNHLLHLQSRFLQLLGYNLNFTEAVYTVLSLRNLTYLDIHMKNCDLWCKVKKKMKREWVWRTIAHASGGWGNAQKVTSGSRQDVMTKIKRWRWRVSLPNHWSALSSELKSCITWDGASNEYGSAEFPGCCVSIF